MSNDARCQTAAAIGQWCHWRVVIAKVRVARKEAVLFTEVAVEPEVGLILIVRLGGHTDEVVGSGYIGQRVVLEDLGASRIEAKSRYGVVLELASPWRCRIEYR